MNKNIAIAPKPNLYCGKFINQNNTDKKEPNNKNLRFVDLMFFLFLKIKFLITKKMRIKIKTNGKILI